jgi:dihydroorotate dehydrogenase electron transfer subunit
MPPSQFPARIVARSDLTGGYVVLELAGEIRGAPLGDCVPGQFVMLRGDWGRDLLNPRAFSVLWAEPDGRFAVMLKGYGRGTSLMCAMDLGARMTVTGPLGRGFRPPSDATQILVAGGVGLPPLYLQARRAHLLGRADRIELIYGGRDRDDLVMLDEFAAWDIPTALATEDGSVGTKGFVTVPLAERLERANRDREHVEVLACGPTPMLAAVRKVGLAANVMTWLCLEEEMACGFGVCLGCAVPVYGDKPYRYCCSDGPVFDARQVRWP